MSNYYLYRGYGALAGGEGGRDFFIPNLIGVQLLEQSKTSKLFAPASVSVATRLKWQLFLPPAESLVVMVMHIGIE